MKRLDPDIHKKLKLLEKWLRNRKGSIVAFSGGVDSSLVLFLARKFQGYDQAIGAISNSESLKNKDLELAHSFCEKYNISLKMIKTHELNDPRYNKNPIDRCFFCKEHLFHDLKKIQKDYPGFDILSGNNYSDLADYRPGNEAAKKNQVLSPLAECKIIKEEIREIARYFGLPNWNKPASPCLSSRIPYNHPVTVEKLKQVEAAEDILNNYGFKDVRVRHYGNFGKIEVDKKELKKLLDNKEQIIKEIVKVGFTRIEIDEEGLVSGKLNREISIKNKKIV